MIVKKQQTLAVSTEEHVQPRNVMQETKSSTIYAIESCPIYVTSVHMPTQPFFLNLIKFSMLTEKAINRETVLLLLGLVLPSQ